MDDETHRTDQPLPTHSGQVPIHGHPAPAITEGYEVLRSRVGAALRTEGRMRKLVLIARRRG